LGATKVDLTKSIKSGATPDEVIDFLISKSADDLLPWEDVKLPSRGLFYDGRIPEGVVKVRPMGLATDKILATQRLVQTGQAIDHLYKACIRFPAGDFDPLDLLVGDRMFLLYYIRGITHGNMYEFSVTCSNENCKQVSTHEYDLNKLAENIRGPQTSREPIKIKLPFLSQVTGREMYVEARFMRGRDLQIMMRTQKSKERMFAGQARNAKTGQNMGNDEKVSLDTTIEENLNLIIESVNGVKDQRKISEIIRRLHGKDTAVIRETLRNSEPGIDTNIMITCPGCATEMTIGLPITESFFRPTESRGT
jgi:hypothetical protein